MPLIHSYKDIQATLDSIWLQCGALVYGRLEILQKAAEAMAHGRFNADIERQCIAETHCLLGELGTFGFEEAFTITTTINQLLKKTECRSSEDAAIFAAWLCLLRKELDQITPAPKALRLVQ